MYKFAIILIGGAVFLYSCGGGDDNPTGTDPDQEPQTGVIEISTQTTGKDKDDSYTITAGGTNNITADSSDIVFVSNLQEGSYELELTDIADNCSVDGSNPRSVNVSAGDTTSTEYSITCKDVVKSQIAFASNRTGGTEKDYEIYLMNTNGASPQQITNNADFDAYPSISPDGQQIAFGKRDPSTDNFDLYLMDADGSNIREIVSGANNSKQPPYISWSPDGQKIAFNSLNNGNYEIYTANSDGTNQVNITGSDSLDAVGNHAWSPDGSKILFVSDRGPGTDNEIYTCNTDGTGVIQLTDNEENELFGAWSPDGSQIAFIRTFNTTSNGLYIMNSDGTGVSFLAETATSFGAPTWSPDGSEITFQRTITDSNTDLIKVNADGSGLEINLTSNQARDATPHWSPAQ